MLQFKKVFLVKKQQVRRFILKNPWENISLDDYENHMQLESVYQTQTMNHIMYDQFYDYPVSTIMILGIAGGNGLNHVKPHIKKVYGVNINAEYLKSCETRYAHLGNTLQTIQADLTKDATSLPMAEMLIANLFVEYIGTTCFAENICKINPTYVSVVIQVNGKDSFISPSPIYMP